MQALRPLLAAIIMLTAGCLAQNPDGTPAPTGSDGPVGSAPARAWANFTGCTSLAAFRFVSFDHANEQLPRGKGFEAEDAGRYVVPDGDVRLGVAFVALVTFTCDALDAGPGPARFATLLVYVKAPKAGAALEPMPFDFYVVDLATDHPAFAETAAAYGMAVTPAAVSNVITMAASGPNHEGVGTGDGALRDRQGALAAYTVAAGAPRERTFLIRGWHAGEAGIAAWDLALDPSKAWVLIGGLTECSMRAGSMHARVFGSASCGDDATGSIIAEPQRVRSSFRMVVPS